MGAVVVAALFAMRGLGCTCTSSADARRFWEKKEHMSYDDRGRPEAELVLWAAMLRMEAYRAQHGRYADQWPLLDIEFALPNWHKGDTGLRPPADAGAVWRPKGCESTYVIRSATVNTVLIQSVNAQGEVDYEIEQGMEDPRKVGPAR